VRYNSAMPNPKRVAIVTGGSGALGQAITTRLLADGDVVCVPWVVDRERERLQGSVDASTRTRLHLERCDVSDDAAMNALVAGVVARHGRVDVLVSAVGGFAMGDLVQTDRATWDKMLALNLTTQYVAAHATLPHMLAAGSGRIVAVASRAVVPPSAGFIAYTVAKAGVIAFVQALAAETRGRGVTVNAVLPSTMDTPANRAAMPDVDPKTWVPVAAVADAIAYLAAPASAHVTGTLLAI
jgi:NAD(P)-dependent dehydrogenase (short-subunit alcohol dehydrogenase family)